MPPKKRLCLGHPPPPAFAKLLQSTGSILAPWCSYVDFLELAMSHRGVYSILWKASIWRLLPLLKVKTPFRTAPNRRAKLRATKLHLVHNWYSKDLLFSLERLTPQLQSLDLEHFCLSSEPVFFQRQILVSMNRMFPQLKHLTLHDDVLARELLLLLGSSSSRRKNPLFPRLESLCLPVDLIPPRHFPNLDFHHLERLKHLELIFEGYGEDDTGEGSLCTQFFLDTPPECQFTLSYSSRISDETLDAFPHRSPDTLLTALDLRISLSSSYAHFWTRLSAAIPHIPLLHRLGVELTATPVVQAGEPGLVEAFRGFLEGDGRGGGGWERKATSLDERQVQLPAPVGVHPGGGGGPVWVPGVGVCV